MRELEEILNLRRQDVEQDRPPEAPNEGRQN
jgi:hypothetical protein